MKSTGISKYIDKLGRFKIPKELRTLLNIEPDDSLCISLQGQKKIHLDKIEDSCIFCHSSKNIHIFKGKVVCESCLKQIKILSSFHFNLS